ncbi:hypothetical protein BDW69DRAFT_186074 [Aspergillus filifer]
MAIGMFEYPPRYERLEDSLGEFAAWMPNFVYVALGNMEWVLRELVVRLERERERVIVEEMDREFRVWEESQVARNLTKGKERKDSSEEVSVVTATETSEEDFIDNITSSLEEVQLESFSEMLEVMTRANENLITIESAIRKPVNAAEPESQDILAEMNSRFNEEVKALQLEGVEGNSRTGPEQDPSA